MEVVAEHAFVAPPNAIAAALNPDQVCVTVIVAVAKEKSSLTVQVNWTKLLGGLGSLNVDDTVTSSSQRVADCRWSWGRR